MRQMQLVACYTLPAAKAVTERLLCGLLLPADHAWHAVPPVLIADIYITVQQLLGNVCADH